MQSCRTSVLAALAQVRCCCYSLLRVTGLCPVLLLPHVGPDPWDVRVAACCVPVVVMQFQALQLALRVTV
jgi:hypothetical protein